LAFGLTVIRPMIRTVKFSEVLKLKYSDFEKDRKKYINLVAIDEP